MSVVTITMPAPRVAAMQRLFAAFRTTPTESMAGAYKDGLADVPDDILTRAVFAAIQAEKFLPSVAELRMYADRFAAPPETRTPPAPTVTASDYRAGAVQPLADQDPRVQVQCLDCEDSGWVESRRMSRLTAGEPEMRSYFARCRCATTNPALQRYRTRHSTYARKSMSS